MTAGTLELYPFQATAVDGVRDGLHAGHKMQILCAPTGAGKTEIAAHLIMEAMQKRSRVAFVCDRRVLVDQTSKRFSSYSIPHGIAMADDTVGRSERIQVCSAQTIERRDYWSTLDILIIDEAHAQRKTILEFAREWGGPVIGLTATPMTPGLGRWYTHVVNATTTDYLTRTVNPRTGQSYLAPLRIFPATPIDMSNAKTVGGEWTAGSVHEAGSRIVGDVVSEWERLTKEHFGGPVSTLLFTASVVDGENYCRAFQAAGYDFRQTTYRDSTDETETLIEGFRRGQFIGLVSVSKLTKGFDVPTVLCGIDARPNKGSLTEVAQKMGRIMRSDPSKEYGLWLDHAENVLRWYDEIDEFWANGVDKLDDGKREKGPKAAQIDRPDLICSCGYVLPPGAPTCPSCGKPRPRRRSTTEIIPGRLGDELVRPGSREWKQNREWTWQQICRVATVRKRGDEGAAQKFALAQYRSLYDEWPENGFELDHDVPDQRVANKIKQQLIAYFKRKKAS